ncbi:beta-L-arabinofuranosidase domain-containing protein [Actinomycetota bacterium Odt1-20B]
MPLNRRDFLHAGALGLTALTCSPLLAAPTHAATATAARGRSALAPEAFTRLKTGSIRARGWLAGQLELQLAGLCGKFADISPYLDFATTGWVHPDNDGWEELPYWLRGYLPLAIATRDATALATSRRWVDAILATQQDDGFFGPRRLRTALGGGPDFWPFLPLLMALRTWQEYADDDRIVPFLTRFLHYMNAQRPEVFKESWISYRLGDAQDIAQWLYERTGDAFLLDLCDTMHAQGADWSDNIPSPHNVNISQGFREPAQYARRSGDEELTRATYRTYAKARSEQGQFPGGGLAGDENFRPGFADPRQGFETCGIVEFMASHELLTRLTGDPLWADRCEDLAFNMLPAALDPEGKGVHYITSANSIDLDDKAKTQGQFQNGFAMQAYQPGIHQYRCCPHNYGMGWPYFAEELWLGTPDHGLAAAMYAASEVTATVGAGRRLTVTSDTDYPFTDTVRLTLATTSGPVAFPLYLRVPGWCTAPEVQVNGRRVPAADGPAFARIDRTWRDGDVVTLRLPQRTTLRTWPHGAVSVDRGPLTYSLKIGEKYVRYDGDATFPHQEVHATTPWNYGLVPGRTPTVHRRGGALPANPFTHEGSPVSMTARARRITAWTADDEHVVTPLRQSPARSDAAVEEITLIPMGAARLRLTSFPTAAPDGTAWTPAPPFRRIENRHSGKVLAVDRMSLDNGAHVVQFDNTPTGDHAWQLVDRGDGWFLIRNGHSGKVLGVDGMSTENSAQVVQFEDNGTADHLWRLDQDTEGWFRVRNKHSGKVLGVDGMSTQNSAEVVQFEDNGTADHLWRFL